MLGKFFKQNHRPAKLSYSFSSKWRKNSGELKIPPPPKAQGSRMPLARAVYHDLLRRVAERSNQGRNDGVKGHNSRAPKSPNNVTRTFFNTVHLLPEDLRFENGGAKLASCPGAI